MNHVNTHVNAKTTTTNKPLPSNIIYCPRSGLALAKVEALCSHGWPLINSLASTTSGLVHPIYGMPLDKLIVKLKGELTAAEAIAWCSIDADQREVQLTMSAIMYAIDAIWQPPVEATHMWNRLEPSLPAWPICVASGSRLMHLASWYHYATSKRLAFPGYRVSSANANTSWQNFSTWLDDAWSIKTDWEARKDSVAQAEEIKARTDALLAVKGEHIYKRIDFNRVWKWIDIQMAQDARYPAGRRETFKSIFMSGDMHPEEWTVDDVEDVQLAVLETCDMGNDIMFFIRTRLNNIRSIIQDFYSSFTLLTRVSSEAGGLDELDEVEQEKTSAFFAGFDKRAESLEALPPEPKRESFATLAKFLQAQAQHRILARRYDMSRAATQAAQSAPTVAPAQAAPAQSTGE